MEHTLGRVASVATFAFGIVLAILAVVELVSGLHGESGKLVVLIGGAFAMFLAPRLTKLAFSKDGVSLELMAKINDAIDAAKESTEKTNQLILQGAGPGAPSGKALIAAGADTKDAFDIQRFIAGLPTPSDAQDPQKGRFGGVSSIGGVTLDAHMRHYNEADKVLSFDVFVTSIGNQHSLEDTVYFVLHPSYTPNVYIAPMREGKATIFLRSWGAFTIGAIVSDGAILLELDLAEHMASAPRAWRAR